MEVYPVSLRITRPLSGPATGLTDVVRGVVSTMFSTVRPPSQSSVGLLEPGRYGVELVRFEDEGVSQFAQPDDQNPPHRIRWIFHVYLGKEAVNTPDGDLFELFAWTSSATGAKSSARPWFEALLGRPLVPGDGGEALVKETIGKKAWAMIDVVREGGEDGSLERDKVKILSMSPIKAGQKPGAATPPPAPKPVEAPLTADDMAAVPF